MAREALQWLPEGSNWLPRRSRRHPKECKIAPKKRLSRWQWQTSMQNNSLWFLIHTLHLTFHSSYRPCPQIHNSQCTTYDFQVTAFPPSCVFSKHHTRMVQISVRPWCHEWQRPNRHSQLGPSKNWGHCPARFCSRNHKPHHVPNIEATKWAPRSKNCSLNPPLQTVHFGSSQADIMHPPTAPPSARVAYIHAQGEGKPTPNLKHFHAKQKPCSWLKM